MEFAWKVFLKKSALFAAIFALFTLPMIINQKDVKVVQAEVKFPKQQRHIASFEKSTIGVAQKQCEPATRWRYKCDEDRKNCVKDKLQTYLKCKAL